MKKPNLTYIDPENYKRFSIPTAGGAKQVEGITVRALRKALESADPDMLVLYMAEQPSGVMLGCIGGAAFAESPPMVVLFGPEALGAIKKMAMEPLTTTEPPPAPVEVPIPPVPPVDRSNVCTTDGKPLNQSPDDPGQHANYQVLCDEERAKGFVRPVRSSYLHLTCGTVTTMGTKLSETYARDPGFYGSTYCCQCRGHFPVGAEGEFVWSGTNEKVGT